jgi:hypothetical protein
VKYLSTYKIFEEKVDWNTIVDIFLYRSFEDLIKFYLQPIIQNKHPVIYLPNLRYGGIIVTFLKHKKEFRNDLYTGMVKRLKKIADKMVIKYYNDKDSN